MRDQSLDILSRKKRLTSSSKIIPVCRFDVTGAGMGSLLPEARGWRVAFDKPTSLGEGFDNDNLKIAIYQGWLDSSAITVDMAWLSFLKGNHTEDIDRRNLTKIISGLRALVKHNQFSLLSSAFEVLDEKSSIDAIICLLRATFFAKSYIKEWGATAQKAKAWIASKGEDPEEILSGLV